MSKLFTGKEIVGTFCGAYFITLILSIAFSLLMTWPAMWLWNLLMPELFGLGTITFWEMFALSVLIDILIGKVTIKNN